VEGGHRVVPRGAAAEWALVRVGHRSTDAVASHLATFAPRALLTRCVGSPDVYVYTENAFEPCGILVNYWWNTGPAWRDPAMGALLHALRSLRDRHATERATWRAMSSRADGIGWRGCFPRGSSKPSSPIAAARSPDRLAGCPRIAPSSTVIARRR